MGFSGFKYAENYFIDPHSFSNLLQMSAKQSSSFFPVL